jgi:hypothetical protein
MPVWQIAIVSTPVSQAVNSVSSTVAIFPTSHQCRDWEDSFSGVADSVYSLVTEEIKTNRIPSPAKGLIKQGFFGPRAVSSSPSVVKEASLLSQGFKDDSSLGVVELCRVKEAFEFPAMEEVPAKADKNPASAKGLIRQGFLGSKIASPSMLVVKEVLVYSRLKG